MVAWFKKTFTTKSVYEHLEKNIARCDFKWIWRAKIPLQFQIFLWQLFQDVVLTRDVMKRRNWASNPKCSFCNERETSQHLLFLCPFARIVWRTVGSVFRTSVLTIYGNFTLGATYFYLMVLDIIRLDLLRCDGQSGNVVIVQPLGLNILERRSGVLLLCIFFKYWACLLKKEDKGALEQGAVMLRENAANMVRICTTVH